MMLLASAPLCAKVPAMIALDQFLATLRKLPLWNDRQRKEVQPLLGAATDVQALARQLVRDGWLSSFQANRLVQGKASELMLGPYMLVEKLGAGGMGEVYKARQPLLDRLVAIKII